ncbi:MAG: amidohydrolase [Pseudomonadota bacterium]
MDRISEELQKINQEMIELRRDFHRFPELGMEERETAGKVAAYLSGLGLEVTTGVGGTGVVALLKGGRSGPTLLLRADMDALPITEENEAEYRSTRPGVMHACGHDGHVAILLGAAKILAGLGDEFPGTIKFLFQPGEETFCGAKAVIAAGVLENPRVDAALGLHLMSFLPVGFIGCRAGAMMAGVDSFDVIIKGQGGHGAMPEYSVDAVVIAAQAITALQTAVSRETPAMSPLVVHVGTIKGGTARNIVADRVELSGTVRTLDDGLRKSMPERIERILAGTAQAMRGECRLDYIFENPPLVNDADLTELVKMTAGKALGYDKVINIPPTMGGEDMAFYLEKAPGCFFFVGAGSGDKGLDKPHHNSRFDIDEKSLAVGAEVLIRSALAYLTS